ncbi:Derlin-1 [Talaromyces pinophilus]|nr:Derlin-1 [Talaromyces pinophilus]
MPSGHHLVYFPPQVTLSQLLPDGTDILHTPGEPFNRRLWAGGKITFPQLGAESSNLLLNGQRAVCVENIDNVDVHGSEGNEKILVTIDRRFTEVHEHEDETQIRARVASNGSEVLVEKRTLFFMRDLDLEQQIERDRRKSRTLTALAFFEGLAIHGQFIPGFRFIFAPNLIFTFPPEPWRLITPFFYIGGGLSFFFDLYFLYTYASGLERGAPRFALPGDFTVYLIFVCTVIMITAYWYLSARVFTKVALTHTWSQVNRGQIVTFYVIQIKAEYLPVCLLLLDVVSGGWPAAIMSMIGIFASHMYDFFTRLWPLFGGGRNYLKTPAFLHRLWGTRVREQRTRGLGPSAGSSSQASSGQSSARDDSIGSSWSMRGAGRRLGGN